MVGSGFVKGCSKLVSKVGLGLSLGLEVVCFFHPSVGPGACWSSCEGPEDLA